MTFVKHAIFASDMQKSVHKLRGRKSTIFELLDGLGTWGFGASGEYIRTGGSRGESGAPGRRMGEILGVLRGAGRTRDRVVSSTLYIKRLRRTEDGHVGE